MHIRSFLLSVVSVAALVGAAANAQTLAEQIAQQSEGEIQGYGNFFRYRIDGLDPSLYDTPVVKVVQPRKFFIGEKADLTVNVRGGNRPYAFSLIGPALPKGLSFDPRKGNFVGTTKLPGSASYVMAVQDARGRIAQSDPFTVTWLDDFDESQFHAYPVEAFVDGAKLPSPQPIFDGSATTDVATTGFGSTVAVRFDQPVRAKTAVVAFSTEAAGGACSYDLEAKDEDDKWRPVHRASSLASGGVLSAFNLMPTPRSGFVSTDWRVNLTNGCRMRLSELRIASAPPNPPPAWQTPEGLLVAVGPVPLGVSIVAPEQSPYSNLPTRFELAGGSTLPQGFGIKENGEFTGPDGEGFPYGRIDFRLRATDGIGYWTERNYFITPDAVPARTAYPKTVAVGSGPNVRFEMSDGKTGSDDASETVPAGGTMLFDYGRFVRVVGRTILAGANVGTMALEAEAGPDQWVDPTLVGGIAKRWRLVNQSGGAATLTEARLDEADYNHPPEWKTAEGPWSVGAEGMSFAGVRDPVSGKVVEAAAQVPAHQLTIETRSLNIFDQGPATVMVAPGTKLPEGLIFGDGAFTLPKGEDFPSGQLSAKLRAADPMGFWSERTFLFRPETVRAATRMPSIAGPSGDVSLLLNDGETDAAIDLAIGEELVWSFGRYVEVKDKAVVVASKGDALLLEAETVDGWVDPSRVAGIAKRFRVRATAAVKVSEFRLDGASPILKPTWSPAASLRTVDEAGIGGSGDLRLAVAAVERNPYSDIPAVVTAPKPLPRGFTFADGVIRVPYGQSFPAGLVHVTLAAVDGLGVASTQVYPFQPASVRAASIVPKVAGGGIDDPFFVLNDGEIGADARAISLQADDTVVWDYGRFVRIEQANVVDATDPSRLALEADTDEGWVPVAAVNTVSRRYRVRATAAVDVREFRIDGAAAPQAPLWNTSAGPYVVDDRSIEGRTGFTLDFDATTRNPFTTAAPTYALRNVLPNGFTVSGQTISVLNGSAFPSGRVGVTVRAEDGTGFYADRTFAFNPKWVRARPIKPDVRDPAGADVFGIMSDGRSNLGVQLKAGEAVTLSYGQWVNASNGAAVSSTGTVVVEAQTASGWIPAKDADWIAHAYRVRAVTDAFLSEVRLDGLPAQSGPEWLTAQLPVREIASPTSIGLSARPQSEFSDQRTVTYSAAGPLPEGFAVNGGSLSTPSGEQLPAGLLSVTVRATDSVGVYSDLSIPLMPSAPRAIHVKPFVKGPAGDDDLFRQMSDGVVGAGAAGTALAVGESLVFDFGRYVFLYASSTIDSTGSYVFEAETGTGWVPPGSVNSRAKRFRFRATDPGIIREARLDGLEVQLPPIWDTLGTLRTVDQAGLALALSTSIQSRFGSPIAYAPTKPFPQGFSLSGSTLVVPPGESFTSGSLSFVLRATDAVGFATDREFAFQPASVRAKTVIPSNVVDPNGATVTQILNDDVKGSSAAGVALAAGQTVVWSFPRYVKVVPADNVVDATAPAALVLETDGGPAGWVPASSLDTGKRFRIRATAAVTVREYRLDGVGAFVLPTWTTAAQPWEVSPTAVAGQTGLQLQTVAANNSPFAGAMAYALVPGASLPQGFTLSATGLISVPSADVFPAGRVNVPVRATDPVGNFVDRTFAFHPLAVPASTFAPKTVASDAGADLRVAMLDGRTAASDASVVLQAGQSIVYDYGTQWVRVAAASVFDVAPTGAVLETVAADGGWVQMTPSPASAFPAAVQDQGGRKFRIRQVTGSSTLREARLGGLPVLGPVWQTAAGPYPVDQSMIIGVAPAGFEFQLSTTRTAITGPVSYAFAPGYTPPPGFSLTAEGKVSVPRGESFAARRYDLPIRATTDDYTSDRTFTFHPAGTAAAGVVPKTVATGDGADVRVALLDGRMAAADEAVTVTTGQTIVYTYDRWVLIQAAAFFDVGTSNLGLEVQAGDGSWVSLSTAPFSIYPAAHVDQVGRVFRLRQTTGSSSLREARLGGLPALGPVWGTSAGPYTVNQSTIVGYTPAGLSLPLGASKTALTASPVGYALAPAFTAPAGFAVSADGKLVVPAGESFPYGRVMPVVRATADDYTSDRTFVFNPASVRLNSIAPTSVLDKSGASVVVPLYDGATGTSATGVTLNAGESIIWTYPRFVQNVAAANVDGVNLGNLVFEVERAEGEWVVPSSVDSIGRRFRIRSTAAGTLVREYRLDGAGTFLSPAWVTAGGSRTVTETTIGTTSPATLSLQLQATNRSPYSNDPLRYELAPGSAPLPAGFAMTQTGLVTVPKASAFPVGTVNFAVRVWDSTGFFADLAFNFLPEVVAMTAQMPSSVAGPDGPDVFVPLYSGLNDVVVTIRAGQSVTWTFPRFVTPAAASFYVANTNLSFLALETPAQDGSWTLLHYANNPGATGVVGAYGRTYRLRNTSGVDIQVSSARLGGVPAQAPTWNTSNTNPYMVTQTVVGGLTTSAVSSTQLSVDLSANQVFSGATGLSYAAAPGAVLPAGFEVLPRGSLRVPVGESFTGGFAVIPVRVTDTRGFYSDRTFNFYPASVAASSLAPSSVAGADGADVFTTLYDGLVDRVVELAPNQSVTVTFPKFVNVTRYSAVTWRDVNMGGALTVELMRADGTWIPVTSNRFVISTVNGNRSVALSNELLQTAPYNVGRQFRVKNNTAAALTLGEYRIDQGPAYKPTFATTGGPWEVNQTQVLGATPAALSFQIGTRKTYPDSTDAFTYALAPGSKALPSNFGLSSSGLVVVPQGESFTHGSADFTVRATDSRGFYADQNLVFHASSVPASSVKPTSVTGPSGASVYAELYDGRTDRSVVLQPGEAVTVDFAQYVRIANRSSWFGTGYVATLVTERPNVDGSWSTLEQIVNDSQDGVWGDIAQRTSKSFRIRNAGTTGALLREQRLDQAPSLEPAWVTGTGPFGIDDDKVAGQSGLSMPLAATKQSPATGALTYALVAGQTVPEGFVVDPAGRIGVPAASDMPSGRVDLTVRASDGLGFYADQTLTFIPSAAVRAQSVPPAAVSGPNGEDLRVALYDDRGDTAYTLAAGQAVTFTWDRWVQVADVVKASPAPRTPGVLYAIETLAQDGSWRRIGSYAVPATGSISDTTAASGANRYGRTFRIVNTSGSPTAFSELRPDNGPGYGVSITTPTDQRLVDESTISGATKAGFDLQLAGKWSHPASKSLSWMLRGVTPIGFAVSGDGVVSVPRGSDFPFGRVIVPVQAVDDRGYTRDADYPFVPASVRAKGVIPQSVVGPNGEDLFVAMYDGRSDTTFTLGAGQSITYTFDRFVTVVDGTTAIQTHTANTYVIEVPNQNGGWTVAVGVQNGSQNTYNADYAASKIFRIRNALTGSNLFYNAPLDGAANFRPQITTSTTGRVVDENGIRGASPAAFTLQLAATDNYPAGGRITWSAYNPLPEGVTLSADGLITVPPGTAFPSGNVTVYARATNSRGFAGDAAFPFRPDSVRAATVSPVSVVGPGEKDLRIGLYDNAVNNYVADLATDHAVVYTYDRFVRVENFTQSTGGYATNTNYPNVELQVPNQFGGWSSAGYFYYNSSTAFGDYLNPNLTTSKVFRVVTRRPMSVAEFRLDGAPSYGLTIATSQAARTVNGAGIIGANPAGTSLQLAASTSNPAVKSVRWTLTGVMPTGFTLSESGLATVPTGPEFPFGVVNMPVRALDDQGFGATGNFQFQAASVRANTVAPDSVVGPNNEDLRIALYDGSASTFTLQAGQSITYTYDRFVQVSSVSPGSGYVGNSLIAGQINQLSLEVPNQYGGWTQVAVFWADSSSIYASSLPWADNTAKIFRVRNLGSQATRLSDFRLDNPPSYGLAIGTGTQLRYVDDTNGIDTIRDASPAGLGLQLAAQPGHPLSKSVTWSLTGVTPTGFTLGADGLLTVPALADFPFGLVTVPVQAKDDRGYTAFATYSFMANSVRARTVPPVSVAGPNGEDLATVLYDGGANTRFTLQPGASVTYTYDRYVTVADAGIDSGASAAYYLSGVANGSLRLEAPLQDGGWQTVAFFDTNSAGVAAAYISAQRASKVFRLRNVGTPAITLFDFRLDRAQSYGAAITTAVNNRIVGAEGLSIQLTAVSGHPDAAGFTWSLSGATPIGFTLSSAGFLTVPVGPDFPFGFVNMPVQAVDTKGFRATANFGFLASSVDARTIKPASVVGPGGEDLFAKLYDGDTSTAFDLQSGASVTFTFDRFVNVTDVSTAAGAYAASMSGTGGFLLEVPMQDGSWGASHRFAITDSTFTSSAVFNNVLNQSRIFRLRNTGAATTSLKEFRLDAPASYGLTWGQGGTFFVGDDRIASTNNGTTAPFTDGLTLIMQATSGYPGDPSVSYGWKPGFVPPEGFSLTNGGVLTVPAASVFPAGTVALPIRATSALGFHSLDRTFTFVPQSVRAATVAPASVLDPSGQSVYAGLYDDDVSTSSTNALTLAPGQSVTWTYPKWTHLLTTSSVVANASSTTLLVERQLPDGSWQTMETRAMSGGTSSGINLGTPYPSKVWRLRNVGQASAPLIEWRLDGAGSYAPVFGTTLSTRYVTPSTIVDAVGGGTPTANSTGLTMRLLGTVRSPGEGSLAWSWGNGFMPPEGFTLSADGLLTVTDREAFPFGLVQMPIKATDPRGFGVTRVTNFSPDPARANAVLRPAQTTVKSPTDADLFTMMIDGVTAAGSTLEAGQSITWTFSRYVYLQSAATGRNLSSQSWQLEVPNQIGGWTAVENQAGLLNGSDARIARTYRLRNVGASAITVGEYNIDGATQGSAPTPLGYGSDGQGVFFVGDYSGSAVTFQLRYSSGDPYRGGGLSYVAGTLPAGITVSSTGLVSVPSGKRYSVSDTFQVTATNALNRSSVTTFRLRDTREVGVVQFLGYLGWADGSYADSCHAYRNPAAPKVYNGATGDGVYRINPQGVVFDVYCDMTTDGGGWTQAFVLANGSIEQIYDQLSVMYVRAKQLRYLNRVGFRQDTGSGAVAGAKYAAICDLPNAGGGSSLASSLDSISWGPLPNVTTGASASSLGSFPPVNLCRWKVTDGSRGGGRGGYEDTSALLSMDPQATAYEVDYAIGIGQMETAPNVNGEDTVVWIR